MGKISDKLFDLCPSGLYRAFYWIKKRPQHIRWWFQRANGKLPECDLWSYKYTLIDNLSQGIDYLLREDTIVDYNSDKRHRQLKKDLEFIQGWLNETRHYFIDHTTEIAYSDEEREVLMDRDIVSLDDFRYLASNDWFIDYYERQKKAFQLLDKHLWELWD